MWNETCVYHSNTKENQNDENFEKLKQLDHEKVSHDDTDDKNFKCDECGVTFCKKYNLRPHKSSNSGEKPLKCVNCCKKIVTRRKACQPLMTATEMDRNAEKSVQCSSFGICFQSASHCQSQKESCTTKHMPSLLNKCRCKVCEGTIRASGFQSLCKLEAPMTTHNRESGFEEDSASSADSTQVDNEPHHINTHKDNEFFMNSRDGKIGKVIVSLSDISYPRVFNQRHEQTSGKGERKLKAAESEDHVNCDMNFEQRHEQLSINEEILPVIVQLPERIDFYQSLNNVSINQKHSKPAGSSSEEENGSKIVDGRKSLQYLQNGNILDLEQPDIRSDLLKNSVNGLRYCSTEALQVYMRGDTSKKSFACHECGRRFSLFADLERHIQTQTSQKASICAFCGRPFSHRCALQKHRYTSHLTTLRFECKVCGKRFITNCALQRHMMTHTGEKPFFCNVCGKDFTLGCSLKRHARLHSGKLPHSCSQCGKRFNTSYNLKKHLRRKARETLFKCHICGLLCCSADDLLRHKLQVHKGEKHFHCPECGSKFIDAESLETHKKEHKEENKKRRRKFHRTKLPHSFMQVDSKERGITNHDSGLSTNMPGVSSTSTDDLYFQNQSHRGEKPFKCSVCGIRFDSNFCLEKHMRIHTGERPFACSKCGKAFSFLKYLKLHIKIHTVEKLFKCSQCGKAFNLKRKLNLHIRRHSGIRSCICAICGKSYSDSGTLSRHKRRYHGAEAKTIKRWRRSLMCDVCGRIFSNQKYFETHMRTHSGEKPFVCDDCGKRFSELAYLTRHRRLHTGEKPFKCDVCGKPYICSSSVRKHKIKNHPQEITKKTLLINKQH